VPGTCLAPLWRADMSLRGSWLAGVNGARAGFFMPTRPRVGRSALQEYYKGHAERNTLVSIHRP
jgi:hypothetical protein